jgi:hypothetical protein
MLKVAPGQPVQGLPWRAMGEAPAQCCIVGTSPAPWAVTILSEPVPLAETPTADTLGPDWSSVASALGGQVVIHPPSSWNQGP